MNHQPINGTDTLGFGINIFGQFNNRALKERVFDMTCTTQTKSFDDKTIFAVPDNVDVINVHVNSGKAEYAENRRKYDSHFTANAKVKAGYLGFTATAEASFSRKVGSDVTTTFGIYSATSHQYDLTMRNLSASNLSKSFTDSDLYKNLPQIFDAKNAANVNAFFRFFAKFGTHVITNVQMGGLLEYSVATTNGTSYTEQEMSAKITAEYKGVFGASGSAESAFKEADQKWFNSTTRMLYAEGGDNVILNTIMPAQGRNNENAMADWLRSIANKSKVLAFQVVEIAQLFPETQAGALKEAYMAYMHHHIKLTASDSSGSIRVKTEFIADDIFSKAPKRFGRFEVAILNRKTLQTVFAKSWDINRMYNVTDDNGYTAAYKDIGDLWKDPNNIFLLNVVKSIRDVVPNTRDNAKFVDLMESCGAGPLYNAWIEDYSKVPGNSGIRYMLVGMCGGGMRNTGIESLVTITPEERDLPPLAMHVFLEPNYAADGSFYGYLPVKMEVPPKLNVGVQLGEMESEVVVEE